jgi:hypothetical protein
MLRIRQGQQERYIWPVHLPGWLAAGWRVAGSDAVAAMEPMFADPVDIGFAAAATDPPRAAELTPPLEPAEPATSADATPAPTRGRRGRRRKEGSAPAETEPTVVIPQESTPSDQLFADSDIARDGADRGTSDSMADETAEPTSDTNAENPAESTPMDDEGTEVPVLTALPDDLFDDPLT